MEQDEENAALTPPDPVSREQLVRDILAWILETGTLVGISNRALIAAYVVSPYILPGMTLHQIAVMSGKGRSAAHNLARDFERRFGVRSVQARSEVARKHYAESYQRRNGSKPHSYIPTKK
jgi:hypothetical protein